MNGLVIVDKPTDWTSHDVVGRLRRLAGTRKVGHAGTLDPMATGVLVVGLNRATRLLGHLALVDKEYLATIRLGQRTITDDAQGEILQSRSAADVEVVAVDRAIAGLTGTIEQVPSSVSAIKVDGKRSYARVRGGEEVKLAARTVEVPVFERGELRREGDLIDLDVRVVCSSGTYVRALARDLGDALGVGGHLTALRRTRVGGFGLDVAHTLDELGADLTVLSLDEVARRSFPPVDLDESDAAQVRYGRPLPGLELRTAGPHAVFDPQGHFLALYESDGAGARAVAVFV